MKLKLYKPKNELLKAHIECIYLLTRTAKEKPWRYLTFPTPFTIVTCSQNSITTERNNHIYIRQASRRTIETNMACNFNTPVHVEYEGAINEITLYFKPLGLNAFLDKDLAAYNTGNFPDFNPFDDYKPSMAKILSIADTRRKIAALEAYWLTKFKGFDQPVLRAAIAELQQANDPPSITALAAKYKLSRPTLNKLFDRHVGKTPSQFRKIVRFRNAMAEYLTRKKRLTDITYSHDYFDQSHMIKDFKTLTGRTPGSFFANISEIEKGQINWLIL